MKTMITTLLAVALGAVATPAARADLLTPAQIADILEDLDKLEKGITADKLSKLRTAVAAFRQGASSDKEAVDLYLECYRLLNFTRNDARTTDYLDWKKRNKDRHGETNFKKALRLQLQFLLLTMRAAEETEPDERAAVVKDLEAFLAVAVPTATGIAGDLSRISVGSDDRSTEGRIRRAIEDARGGGVDLLRMLRGSILNSVFAQAYELDRSIGGLEGWEMSPLGLSGHYSEAILPYYGTIGVGPMGQAWDRWIDYEVRLAKSTKSKAQYDEFMGRTVPGLRWKKAVYFYQVGFQAKGADEMMKLILANRGHPLLPEWYEEFRGLLTKNSAPPAEDDGDDG